MVTTVLVEKPTEKDSTIIVAGDHVKGDDVCITHIRAECLEESQTTTFFKNVYDKSSYDLGNFTKKMLSDNEKRQILDMGLLQPSGPFQQTSTRTIGVFQNRTTFRVLNMGQLIVFGSGIPKY